MPAPASVAGGEDGPDTFFFIPHTHWEGAVFQTREAYLEIGLPNILRALARFAEGGQVMLLTHHSHLIDVARATLGE